MSEVSVDTRAERDARRTWVIGGAVLLASAVLPAIMPFDTGGIRHYSGVVLFAIALVVFALGIRGAGSVTARKPLGTIALVGLAVWTVLADVLPNLLLAGVTSPDDPVLMWTSALYYIDLLVSFSLSLIAVVQILRAGAVPRPWGRAPLWGLGVVTACWVVPNILALAMPTAIEFGMVVLSTAAALNLAVTCFLGVLAIVLALRQTRPDTVPVYRGSGDPDPA
ncbi:hypothetical protein [Microbacterium sp. CJ88]|uniref:hypothetical protein n=1 Tax=Microbacterium sp. CJ88 TaxID=3445672 RepID=UPI003F654A7D